MPEFKNFRAQTPRYLNSTKKGKKSSTKNQEINVLETENRKPKTGNKIENLGPMRFELTTFRLSVERSNQTELRAL